jgi:NifU-like protein involved in Fe-S cluster formation
LNDYSSLVIEHFEHPRNVGHWSAEAVTSQGEVVQGSAGDVAQGVRFALSARVAEGVIQAARFEAYGCPHCIASASWLTEQLPGLTLAMLAQWRWREAARILGVPVEKFGRLLILEDAVRRLAEDWARKL